MNRPIRLLIASSIVSFAIPSAQHAIAASAPAFAPPPLALYGQLPSLEDPVLSPDGGRLAYIVRRGGRRYLAVTDLTAQKLVAVARVDRAKVRGLRWYDDNRLLILYSATASPPFGLIGARREWLMLVSWNVAKNRMRSVSMHDEYVQTMNVVTGSLAVRMVKGHPKLFVSGAYVDTRVLPAMFEIDLRHRRTSVVAQGKTLGAHWAVDADGRIAASFDYRMTGRKQGLWTLRLRRGDKLQRVASGDAALDPPSIVGFSYDDRSLLVEFTTAAGWIWKPLRLADDTWGAALGAGKTFFAVIRDRLTGRVVGGVQDPLAPHQVFFDPKLQAHWSAVVGAYSGERVELVSHSDDFGKFVIRVFGPRDGDRYVLIDWKTVDAYPIGAVYRGLSTIAEVRPIDYPAADGLPLAGFLTLPPGKPARNLSLIVLPHGGPAATDAGDFDWWAQALATRGYAVLQVNYRGSDTTPALLRAGFGEWGRKMQTDLSDGVHYLAARGIVDPKRVCIVGASYGGYAALAGVTLQHGIYRCAAAIAGVADPAKFLRWTSDRWMTNRNEFTRYWDRFLGVTGPDDPRLQAISPIDHVDAVTVPVLLIHGRDDTVVPYAQSEEMAKALRRAGKAVQLLALPHEDHWLSHSATREQMLETVVAFVERNDPPG
ncbi:MAG TPA: prolyl oligopeptidase family serine peptidase [Steroidobacteraceae bacterium]|nr:prolyl oligopeptidase family serine peptidase [Steroidobacteraceae bacterium]